MLIWIKMDQSFSKVGQWQYASPLWLVSRGCMQATWFLRIVAACQFLINFVFQLRDSGCMPVLMYAESELKDSGCMPVLMYTVLELKESGCMPVLMYTVLELKNSGCMPVLTQADLKPGNSGCMPIRILIYFSVAVCQGKFLRG